jgi:hypothetical protein
MQEVSFSTKDLRSKRRISSCIFQVVMYKFHNNRLPSVFCDFFISVNKIHKYNTRLASKQSYYLPKARTNYGIFNIRFQGPTVWNSVDENLKSCSIALFKSKMKQSFLEHY